MYTKLLSDLDEQIRNSVDRVQWARIVCRKASYFARQGETVDALRAIERVRTEFAGSPEPEVACWLMLAEGILQFFQLKMAEAYDRFRGAYGLAKAFEVERALPSCAAWIAHIEFSESNFDSMVRFLEEALTSAPKDDYPALGRASLVLADAFHFAGQFPKARPWYEKARLAATAEEDRSMLSALFHNVATLRAANVRLADACGECNPSEFTRASMEAYSAYNYDVRIGTESFQVLIPLLQSQLLAVEGRFYEALVILRNIDEKELPARLHTMVEVDRAWCSIGLNLEKEGKAFAKSAADLITDQVEPDDTAYVLARLAQIEKIVGETIVVGCAERAAATLARHRNNQAALETKLDRLLVVLGERRAPWLQSKEAKSPAGAGLE